MLDEAQDPIRAIIAGLLGGGQPERQLPKAPPGTHWAKGPGEPLLLRDDMDAATAGGQNPFAGLGTLTGTPFGIAGTRSPQFGMMQPQQAPQPQRLIASGPAQLTGPAQPDDAPQPQSSMPSSPQSAPAPAVDQSRLRTLARVLQNPYASPQIKTLALEEYKRLTTPVPPRERKTQVVEGPGGEKILIDTETGQRVGEPIFGPKPVAPPAPIVVKPGERMFDPGGKLIAEAPGGGSKIEEDAEARRKLISSQGGDQDDPRNRDFILTGRFPREDSAPLTATDKKAILEADEMVAANEATIAALEDAKKISPHAFGFVGASAAATPLSFIGNEEAKATLDLENLITSQALNNLKATFGSAPTEGERKILLDIQGSTSKPDAVRQKIYDRAIAAARRRLDFNKARAEEIRGGEFYKKKTPTDGGNQQTAATPTNVPIVGAPKPGTIEDGYRFKGGNPADPASWEKVN